MSSRQASGVFGSGFVLAPLMTFLLGCASTAGPPIPTGGLKEVLGTAASAELQREVRTLLWETTRDGHAEMCAFDVVKAEPYAPDELSRVGKSSMENARLERKLRGEGKLLVERWTVECCGRLREYEVLLFWSPEDGTDIGAVQLN